MDRDRRAQGDCTGADQGPRPETRWHLGACKLMELVAALVAEHVGFAKGGFRRRSRLLRKCCSRRGAGLFASGLAYQVIRLR